eukprot:m.341364 g.341364  ORF g.341364 m.341364 type:complete len:443 (-) comp20055_c0_seq1:90-1418(-)
MKLCGYFLASVLFTANVFADEGSGEEISLADCLAEIQTALDDGTAGCDIVTTYKDCTASLTEEETQSATNMLKMMSAWEERCSAEPTEAPEIDTKMPARITNEDGSVHITAGDVKMKINKQEYNMAEVFATISTMQNYIKKLEANLLASEVNQYKMKQQLEMLQESVEQLEDESKETDDKLADEIDILNATVIKSKKAHESLASDVKIIDKASVANEKLAKGNQGTIEDQAEVLKNLTRDWTSFDTDRKKGIFKMPGKYAHYTNDLVIDEGGKNPNIFFPLVFNVPGDAHMYELCIRRSYSWKPDTTAWYPQSTRHHAGLSMCVNFMSRQWGGMPPYIDIKHHLWSYTPTIKAVSLSSPTGYHLIVMIRGGGGRFIVEGNLPSILTPKVYTKNTKIYECCNGRHTTWVSPQSGVRAMTSPCNSAYGSGYGQGFNAYRPSCGA